MALLLHTPRLALLLLLLRLMLRAVLLLLLLLLLAVVASGVRVHAARPLLLCSVCGKSSV